MLSDQELLNELKRRLAMVEQRYDEILDHPTGPIDSFQ